MKSINKKTLAFLQLHIDHIQLTKLKQRLLQNQSLQKIDNKSILSNLTQSSPTAATRRPKNKHLMARSQSPDMKYTKSTFYQNKQINNQRAIYYKASSQLPNLHSQDVMNCYYAKQQSSEPSKNQSPNIQIKMKINKSLNIQQLNNLKQLQLYFCQIDSLRNLGTGWKIKSLSVIGCLLNDFSGITGFAFLQDLYASFNRITDLSQLLYNQTLKVIDLEGNEINDIEQIDYLDTVQNLKYINLKQNPIYVRQKYQIIEKYARFFDFTQIMEEQDIQDEQFLKWKAYEGYQQVELINGINQQLENQQSIIQQLNYGIKYYNNFQKEQEVLQPQIDQIQKISKLKHNYVKQNKQLLAYIQQKSMAVNIRKIDSSKSRSKPKLIEIQSKQKLLFRSQKQKQQQSTVTSSMLAHTGKSFRQTIRAQAKKKFLIRKSSIRKQDINTLQVQQSPSKILKSRISLAATTGTGGFRFTNYGNFKI